MAQVVKYIMTNIFQLFTERCDRSSNVKEEKIQMRSSSSKSAAEIKHFFFCFISQTLRLVGCFSIDTDVYYLVI